MAATPDPDAAKRYRRRYRDAFAPDLLTGLRIAVYQQRSVARDLMADLLTALGAAVVAIGRSETFVPIDTEDHRAEDVAFFRDTMASGGFDTLVTTGGDADRPLVADATGRNLRGDVLGLITAPYLGVDAVVVPVTAGSAIERSGEFWRVTRTRVGSPFVIAGMEQVKRAGFDTVVGFAANGGFLLGAPLTIAGRPLPALPTRGAVLPILATLAAAREAGLTLAGLVACLDAGEKASSRLPEIAPERSGALLARLTEAEFRGTSWPPSARRWPWTNRMGSGSISTAGGRSTCAPPATHPSCGATGKRARPPRPKVSFAGAGSRREGHDVVTAGCPFHDGERRSNGPAGASAKPAAGRRQGASIR